MSKRPPGEPRVVDDTWTFAEVIASRPSRRGGEVPPAFRIPVGRRTKARRSVIERLSGEYGYCFTILREFR